MEPENEPRSKVSREEIEWREAFSALVCAQAEMLRWYRDVHGPASNAGHTIKMEPGFDDRNQAISNARDRLLLLRAPDLQALMVKLENDAWISARSGAGCAKAIANQQQADLVLLVASVGVDLRTAPIDQLVGPNYTLPSYAF